MENMTTIKNLIYIVRDVQVMLDADLAALYGYSTKAFNQQVKNNIAKFDNDFRFQLTSDEYHEILRSKKMSLELPLTSFESKTNDDNQFLRSKNLTSKTENRGGRQYLPYVFTEQGIYMLMTVLKGDLATKQSKALIRIFKEMKDFIINNKKPFEHAELARLTLQTAQNTIEIAEIKKEMLTKSNICDFIRDFSNEEIKREYLILNGNPVEANLAYNKIYATAKHKIFVIDNYIGIKTLVLLKNIRHGVNITIFSDNIGNGLHHKDFEDFCHQYPQTIISFQRTCGIYHDRYIIIDYDSTTERIFHCGASSKDAGNKVTTITEVSDRHIYHQIIDSLLTNPILLLPGRL